MISVYSDESELLEHRSEWSALAETTACRAFQTFEWNYHAWKCLLGRVDGNRLWVLKWSVENRPETVIFPFYIDRVGTLRLILDDHSDVGGVICSEDANLHWAFKEVAEAIRSEPTIRRVWLQKLDGCGSALNWLGVFLRGAVIYRDNAYSWIESPRCDDFIMGQGQLKSKDRADLKGLRRKADQAYALKILTGGVDAYPGSIVDDLVSFMKKSNRDERFFPSGMRAFTERIFNDALCDIVLLEGQGRTVALNFLLKRGVRYLSWVFLYSDARASAAMYVKYLTEKAKDAGLVFDFGVGVYDYKIGTFRPQTALTYSLRYSKTLVGTCRDVLAMNTRVLKDWMKAKLK